VTNAMFRSSQSPKFDLCEGYKAAKGGQPPFVPATPNGVQPPQTASGHVRRGTDTSGHAGQRPDSVRLVSG